VERSLGATDAELRNFDRKDGGERLQDRSKQFRKESLKKIPFCVIIMFALGIFPGRLFCGG